jgi:hypothetical protein
MVLTMGRRGRAARPAEPAPLRLPLAGWRRTDRKGGADWTVQPVAADRAAKTYLCPGCGRQIAQRTAHVVVWRADDVRGEEAAIADRRHWHTRCWTVS